MSAELRIKLEKAEEMEYNDVHLPDPERQELVSEWLRENPDDELFPANGTLAEQYIYILGW